MNKFWKIISVYLLLTLPTALHAEQVRINQLRFNTVPNHNRLVFDVTAPATYQVFLLDNPARLVVDFVNTKLLTPLKQPPEGHAIFSRIRSGIRNKNGLRVVADLKEKVSPKSFPLKPGKEFGHRLVVDVYPINKNATTNHSNHSNHPQIKKTVINKARTIVIAIDAGHGGVDPGAHGPKGTKEKKVVFDISKKVAALINKKPGMKAVMVRKGDYFIKLRKRMQIARAAGADLFVSIHADAFGNSNVKGASVFTLSERGATGEAARWLSLAKSENAADFVGGVKLADKEDMVRTVIMDLTQTQTKEVSRKVATKVLKNFKAIGHVHKSGVQKAGFIVLKSPDIPSILIETAFISNPSEERKLRSNIHQANIANAIYRGIVGYFEQYPPADTFFAKNTKRRHIISRGETLSGIAQRYGISMKVIKSVNALASNQIRIGQILTIPRG